MPQRVTDAPRGSGRDLRHLLYPRALPRPGIALVVLVLTLILALPEVLSAQGRGSLQVRARVLPGASGPEVLATARRVARDAPAGVVRLGLARLQPAASLPGSADRTRRIVRIDYLRN